MVGRCQSAASSALVRMKLPKRGNARRSAALRVARSMRTRCRTNAFAAPYTPSVATTARMSSRAADALAAPTTTRRTQSNPAPRAFSSIAFARSRSNCIGELRRVRAGEAAELAPPQRRPCASSAACPCQDADAGRTRSCTSTSWLALRLASIVRRPASGSPA